MIIAKEKRKTNIVEYILYMWQLEDLIRAYDFDIEKIDQQLIARYQVDDNTRKEIRDWYINLIVMMEKEKVQKSGHVQFLKNIINDLHEFHLRLLDKKADAAYVSLAQQIIPFIYEFKTKMNATETNDVEACLNGLYSLILLRLQNKEVSQSTSSSIQGFGKLMAHLSARYLQFEKGDFEF